MSYEISLEELKEDANPEPAREFNAWQRATIERMRKEAEEVHEDYERKDEMKQEENRALDALEDLD